MSHTTDMFVLSLIEICVKTGLITLYIGGGRSDDFAKFPGKHSVDPPPLDNTEKVYTPPFSNILNYHYRGIPCDNLKCCYHLPTVS